MKSSWNKIKFDEIIDILTDYHANGSYKILKENVELFDIPNYAIMIRTTNFESGLDSTIFKYISEDAYNYLKKTKVYSGDIIMNKIANPGTAYYMPDLNRPVSLAMNLFLIRVDENKALSKYIYYYLKVNEAYVKSFALGSVTQTITKQAVRNLVIDLPNIKIQKKITNIIGGLDDKIELNRKMNQTLQEMAQALFKSWFVDFDPVYAKAKCSSEEELGISKEILELFPGEFEDSELGMIPKGWSVKTLNDIVDFQNGYSFKSKELHTNSINSIKVFKMGHIHRGGGFKEEGKDTYFTIIDDTKMAKYMLKKGDLLMAMTDMKANMALLAHTALMPHNNKYLLNQRVGRLRIKEKLSIGYPYLYIFSNLGETIHDLRSRSNSGVQVNLTTKAILQTKIILPTNKLLIKFNHITIDIFDKIFKNDEEIQTLQKTRDTLLPKLLSGEIEV